MAVNRVTPTGWVDETTATVGRVTPSGWLDETTYVAPDPGDAVRAALEAAHAEISFFVDLDLPGGALRLHTRTGTVTWGGHDFLGVGKFGSISEISEDSMLRPSGVTVTLSGVDPAIITAAMAETYHGRTVTIYRGVLDVTTFALISTPDVIFRGLMDFMTIELGQNLASISVSCEGELARWQRFSNLIYSHESQQTLYPGDRGFDAIPVIQGRTINWIKKSRFGDIWQTARGLARYKKTGKI